MVDANLNTTNTLLALVAVVSVLQLAVLVAAAVVGYRLYRDAVRTIREVEERQIAPFVARAHALMAAIDGVLADVRGVTQTIHRIDATAGRVGATVASRVSQLAGLAHNARCIVQSLFQRPRAA